MLNRWIVKFKEFVGGLFVGLQLGGFLITQFYQFIKDRSETARLVRFSKYPFATILWTFWTQNIIWSLVYEEMFSLMEVIL